MAYTLIHDVKYSDYSRYFGSAYEIIVEWYALPEPLDLVDFQKNTVEANVSKEKGTMIWLRIWRESVVNILGYDLLYRYKLSALCHGSPFNPVVVLGLILAILIFISIIISTWKGTSWSGGLIETATTILPLMFVMMAVSMIMDLVKGFRKG